MREEPLLVTGSGPNFKYSPLSKAAHPGDPGAGGQSCSLIGGFCSTPCAQELRMKAAREAGNPTFS